MIEYNSGNLLDSAMQTLVNTVNCVGVMGKGIALDFKNRHPGMYRDYVARCHREEVTPGVPYRYPELPFQNQLTMALFATDEIDVGPAIINFPTKRHWRGKSKLEYIERGLGILVEKHREWRIESLAIPALGCGNGGLDWVEIGPLMQSYLKKLDICVDIYVPVGVDPSAPFAGATITPVAHS